MILAFRKLFLGACCVMALAGCGGGGSGVSTTNSGNTTSTQYLWSFEGGSAYIPEGGIYGSLGVAAPSNLPGARYDSITWSDNSGNLWLFGGIGYDSVPTYGSMNDLWKYNLATKQWTWIGGSPLGTMSVVAYGVYGTQGTAAVTNIPGSRSHSSSWSDMNGNLWLFGGKGYTSTSYGYLNDLWKYNPSSNEWTWVSGSSTNVDSAGVYGTIGTSSATNVPAARFNAVTWTDKSGRLWLFGGYLNDGASNSIYLNDLWMFNTTTNEWTWMGGSSTGNVAGVYGTKGVAATSNFPGGRESAVGMTDPNGNLWLFGGYAYDSTGLLTPINDLWKYTPSTNEWTWVSGDKLAGATGTYGTKGVADVTNVPSARFDMAGWSDASGNIWIFGGQDWGPYGSLANLNDLWMYSPSTNMWTWVTGSNSFDASGSYGSGGIPSASNTPGARHSPAVWTDSSNNFWLFGGYFYNDLWKFRP